MIKALNTYYYSIPLTLICCVYLVKSIYFPIHDFGNYYFGGFFLNAGNFDANLYFPYVFNKTVADLGYANMYFSYAPNTPFLALVFSPFSILPIAVSKIVFNILSSIVFLFSVHRLRSFFNIKKEYILIIPVIFFIPIKNNLLFGQVYFLLFFLLSEGFIAYKKKLHFKMSVFWGLAILLKIFPLFLFGFLLFRRNYKALFYLSLGCGILLLISVATVNIQVWEFYFINVLTRANNGEIAGAFVDNYRSIYMFLKRLLVYDAIENTSAVYDNYNIFKTLIIVLKFIVIGFLYFITKHTKHTFLIFSIWILASTLISPYGSTYGFVLFVYFFLAVSKLELSIKKKAVLFCLLFFVSNISIYKTQVFPFNYLRLFFILNLFLFVIYFFRKKVPLKRFSGVIVLALITLPLLSHKDYKTKRALSYKTPILTYDYSLKNDSLTYYYWNNFGENKKSLLYPFSSIDTTNISIIENQIYYKKKQLTFDVSNKQKAIVCDDKVLYLSDKNRGIGFYDILLINLKNE